MGGMILFLPFIGLIYPRVLIPLFGRMVAVTPKILFWENRAIVQFWEAPTRRLTESESDSVSNWNPINNCQLLDDYRGTRQILAIFSCVIERFHFPVIF
jgi:hypothetical protein